MSRLLPIGAGVAGIAAELVGIQAVFAFGGVTSLALTVVFLRLVSRDELEPPPTAFSR